MQVKSHPPRDRCAHVSTSVYTHIDAQISGNVSVHPPLNTYRTTFEHLGSIRWATRARRATRRAVHTHLGHTRISLHVYARVHTPRHSQMRTPPTQENTPHLRPKASNRPHPSLVPAATLPGRVYLCAHQLLSRTPEPPRSPPVPYAPRSLPTSPLPAHLLRGRLRVALRTRPQEGPRALAAHPEAAPATQLGASSSVSSFWAGGGGLGWGEQETPRPKGPRGS